MDNNSEMYLKILAKGYRSVSEYTDKSRMRYVGPAATAIKKIRLWQIALELIHLHIMVGNGLNTVVGVQGCQVKVYI